MNPDKWTVRKMVIHLTPEQMLNAILKEAGVELNNNEGYIQDIKLTEWGDYWEVIFKGAE